MKKSKEEIAKHLFFFVDHHVPKDPMLGIEILANTLFAYVIYHAENGTVSKTDAFEEVVAYFLHYVHDNEIPIPGLTVETLKNEKN
jgi:hypothetical protein